MENIVQHPVLRRSPLPVYPFPGSSVLLPNNLAFYRSKSVGQLAHENRVALHFVRA